MNSIPNPPNTLTVVFFDDGLTRYVGTPPTSRSVRVSLTPEQQQALRYRGDCESICVVTLDKVDAVPAPSGSLAQEGGAK